jgi:alpha-pyrone synthase
MARDAYLNHIAVAVPDTDVHSRFVEFAPFLLRDEHSRSLFRRMADRCQIEHRHSVLLDPERVYRQDAFPETKARMDLFRAHAFPLARRAIDGLGVSCAVRDVTHVVLTTCTGFYAPGIDTEIVTHYGLDPSVERTLVGFMGCCAAMNALKLARHIVRSEEGARVLVVNLELCTLHFKQTDALEDVLTFLIFADGCSAAIVSAEPEGLALRSFHSTLIPGTCGQITWGIGADGFDMTLSGKVPATITAGLQACLPAILRGGSIEDFRHWAIHPGGRTVLDAVREGAGLSEEALCSSRSVLRSFGNMSSATIMFVLKEIMELGAGRGCGMAFGPGVTVESMLFEAV